MHVLMTTDCVGGVWTYAMELARGLAERGVRVSLATMGPRPGADQRAQVRALRNAELFESDYALEWMDDPWPDVARAGEWLLGLAGQLEPDVVHLNGYAHGALPWRAPAVVVGHSCVLSWWRAVKKEEAPGRWDHYREAVATGLRAADVVVAPSRAMLTSLQRDYGPLPRATVIENARDPKRFAPVEAKEEFVFSAGRIWDEAKNIAALERLAPAIAWPVCIAGDPGPGAAQDTPNRAVRLGRLREGEIAGWLSRAAIYALPARYEPFGLSVLEAALSGCALVLGEIDSLRENWDGAADFVAPEDDQAICRTINGLIDDDARRRRLADRARQRAARFTPQRMARDYLSVYQELATHHPQRAIENTQIATRNTQLATLNCEPA